MYGLRIAKKSTGRNMAIATQTPNLQQQIDDNLKRVYDETLKEDIPDRFKKLLEQLRHKEGDR